MLFPILLTNSSLASQFWKSLNIFCKEQSQWKVRALRDRPKNIFRHQPPSFLFQLKFRSLISFSHSQLSASQAPSIHLSSQTLLLLFCTTKNHIYQAQKLKRKEKKKETGFKIMGLKKKQKTLAIPFYLPSESYFPSFSLKSLGIEIFFFLMKSESFNNHMIPWSGAFKRKVKQHETQ